MRAPRFKVVAIQIERSVRGADMRRLVLLAVPGEPFGVDAEGNPDTSPMGRIEMVLTPEAAAKYQIGEEFDAIFRERKPADNDVEEKD